MMKTLVDKIIELQKRPQLTLGRITLSNLLEFSLGYSMALEDNGIDTSYDKEFLSQFQIYLKKYYCAEDWRNWWDLIINENDGNDDKKAFEIFYQHFNKFRFEFDSCSVEKRKPYEKAFYQIFNEVEMFHVWGKQFKEVFNPIINEKLLLSPINSSKCFWNEEQFKAIQKTINDIGSGTIYIVDLMPVNQSFVNSRYFETIVDIDYDKFCEMLNGGEKVVYSSDGSWGAYFPGNREVHSSYGIYLSGDKHALLGGSKKFVSTFKKYYSIWKNDFENYEKEWKKIQEGYILDISWLKEFKTYLRSYKD